MEIRAPYALIGLFVFAAIVAVFGFVYWLHNTGGLGERAIYHIRFEKTVSGLQNGAAVLFDGVRVGEVTNLQLNRENPRQVLATIAIAPNTPVRTDTQAELDFQGLTGVPVVILTGGASTAPALKGTATEPALLVADPDSGQTLTQSARAALRQVNTILADNAEAFRNTIANLNTFSAALSRNSDRIDSILAGLEQMVGGKGKMSSAVYNLTAPSNFPAPAKPPRGQLVVPEPTGVLMFDTQNVLVRSENGSNAKIPDVQWSDNLPKLVQAKVIQSFENAKYLQAIARPMEGLAADRQLLIDIRNFQISDAPARSAEVEFTAKVLDKDGKIVNARVFKAVVAAKGADAPTAILALDEAFGKTVTELVLWTSGIL
jgi:phospholipid/cholesterol/gamma-HCH transport system substrate-binding protein